MKETDLEKYKRWNRGEYNLKEKAMFGLLFGMAGLIIVLVLIGIGMPIYFLLKGDYDSAIFTGLIAAIGLTRFMSKGKYP